MNDEQAAMQLLAQRYEEEKVQLLEELRTARSHYRETHAELNHMREKYDLLRRFIRALMWEPGDGDDDES